MEKETEEAPGVDVSKANRRKGGTDARRKELIRRIVGGARLAAAAGQRQVVINYVRDDDRGYVGAMFTKRGYQVCRTRGNYFSDLTIIFPG